MSWFQKYLRAHSFVGYDDSVNGWSDLTKKHRILMTFKITNDLFGVLIVLALTLVAIDWLF